MKKALGVIFLLGLVLRVTSLGEHPAGFTPDEASFGYDAYSIMKTGRDQWGHFLPLTLKSFGDGKMALYSYLTIPTISLFGLNEFAVRLPNALLASVAVVVVYFIVYEWRRNEREAILSSLLLATSPWHVMMSRGAFEANLTTFFMSMGVWAFLAGRKETKWLYLSALAFGLNMFSYHAARLVTPLVIAGLWISFRDSFGVKHKRSGRGAALLFCGFLVLGVYSYFGGAGSRLGTAGIFSLAGEAGNRRFDAMMAGEPALLSRVFNNKVVHVGELFIQNYVQYFSPSFLFVKGAGEYTYGMVPGVGVLYLFEAAFLGGFIWLLTKDKVRNKGWILVWIFASPLPAALAVGPGYAANRAVVMIPVIQIASAIGGAWLWERYGKRWVLYVFGFFWVIQFCFNAEDYLVFQRAYGAPAMVYGAREVFVEINEEYRYVGDIVVSKKISEPHIFAAFYGKIDPREYQKSAEGWDLKGGGYGWVDQIPEYNLGRYVFKNIHWELDKEKGEMILAGRPEDFGENALVAKKVFYPNKSDAYWIVKN